ncbi:hypothetical protein [Demequina pelophila]|nr:hypothetical protein [Demequina pelophila]
MDCVEWDQRAAGCDPDARPHPWRRRLVLTAITVGAFAGMLTLSLI